jgi:hypothetical protein
MPPSEAPDEIVEGAAFVSILEWRDLELLEHLQCLEDACLYLLYQQPGEKLAICG